jgi:hypothetical protein
MTSTEKLACLVLYVFDFAAGPAAKVLGGFSFD